MIQENAATQPVRDKELLDLLVSIEQAIGLVREIIDSEGLSARHGDRLRVMITDGVALATVCGAFGSIAAVPSSITVAADEWVKWVDEFVTDLAVRKADAEGA